MERYEDEKSASKKYLWREKQFWVTDKRPTLDTLHR